ncbi:MAG: hypothetical protein AABM33_13375 [Pseudomonadota bacterium]
MTLTRLALALSLFLCFAASAAAGEFRFDQVTLSVPEGFVGPTRAAPDAASETFAFSVLRGAGVPTNVLQLTRYDFGTAPPDTNEATLAQIASRLLLQMLQGVERRRSSYSQIAPEQARLGGVLGVRASWKGVLQGVSTNGVMYCIILGSRALFFHASGPGDTPDDELKLAIRSVEALRVGG